MRSPTWVPRQSTWCYQVEPGVPLPPPAPRRREGKEIYPWPAMRVGDSFLVGWDRAMSILVQVHQKNARYGQMYEHRLVADGIRVWRVN